MPVFPDPGLDAGAARPPLDHAVDVLLPHGLAGELPVLAGRRLEQRRVRISRDAGGADLFVEVLLQIVVTRNLMLLAAFFVQPDPAAVSLHEIIAHSPLEHGVDECRVDHHRNAGNGVPGFRYFDADSTGVLI
jgi:hypothetical protein